MIKDLIFTSVMWLFVKLKIADKLVMTTSDITFTAYCKRNTYL
jgi:hypothetical protein